MISVTGATGWSTQIATVRHGFMVDTLVVIRELTHRYAVRLHVSRIGMAMAARDRDVEWVDGGANVVGRQNFVHAVAVGADSNLCVAPRQLPSMHAGSVLCQLVGAQRRIVLPHVGRIAMALAADFGYLLARDFAFESSLPAHRVVSAGGIATVTTRACESLLRMNIRRKAVSADMQRSIQSRMAIHTCIQRLGKGGRQGEKQDKGRQTCQEAVPHS